MGVGDGRNHHGSTYCFYYSEVGILEERRSCGNHWVVSMLTLNFLLVILVDMGNRQVVM